MNTIERAMVELTILGATAITLAAGAAVGLVIGWRWRRRPA